MANSRGDNLGSVNTVFLLNFLFFVGLVHLYLFNRYICTINSWYFNDLLAMPLILSYTAMLCDWYSKQMRFWGICVLFVGCSIIWEVITPMFISYSVGDVMDIVMYYIGTAIYICFGEVTEWVRKHCY